MLYFLDLQHMMWKPHCKKRHFIPNRYIYLKQIKPFKWLELFGTKAIMLCNNKFTLKQIDIVRCSHVTLFQIDISIWYKVAFLQCRPMHVYVYTINIFQIICHLKKVHYTYMFIDIDSDFVFFQCFHHHVIWEISGLDVSRSHMIRQNLHKCLFILHEFF